MKYPTIHIQTRGYSGPVHWHEIAESLIDAMRVDGELPTRDAFVDELVSWMVDFAGKWADFKSEEVYKTAVHEAREAFKSSLIDNLGLGLKGAMVITDREYRQHIADCMTVDALEK